MKNSEILVNVMHLIDITLTSVKTLRVVSSPAHIHRFGSCPGRVRFLDYASRLVCLKSGRFYSEGIGSGG